MEHSAFVREVKPIDFNSPSDEDLNSRLRNCCDLHTAHLTLELPRQMIKHFELQGGKKSSFQACPNWTICNYNILAHNKFVIIRPQHFISDSISVI